MILHVCNVVANCEYNQHSALYRRINVVDCCNAAAGGLMSRVTTVSVGNGTVVPMGV